MKHFFFYYGRFFLLAFALGFLMPRLNPGFLKTDSFSYSSAENLDDLIVGYHLQMNEITNGYIERLLASEDPNVLYPPEEGSCDEENLSTFCLASALNQNLIAYETELMARKSTLEDLSGQVEELGEEATDGSILSLEEALSQAVEQKTVLEEQMQNAEDALDLTLAVYNQLQVVYPLHKELVNLRYSLEDFRDNLALVRDVIEIYPSKFNGATTAQCK